MKFTNLPEPKLSQLLFPKPSDRTFALATRNFMRTKLFGRFTKHFSRVDLAYFYQRAKNKKGVKYLLVRQDLFDRTVVAQRLKIEFSKTIGSCIFDYDYTKESTKENMGLQGNRLFLESFKNIAKLKYSIFFSTKTEMKAAFAECTIRSLKNILHR